MGVLLMILYGVCPPPVHIVVVVVVVVVYDRVIDLIVNTYYISTIAVYTQQTRQTTTIFYILDKITIIDAK